MRDFEEDALDDIREDWEAPVTYDGAGLAGHEIMAIRSSGAAEAFQGPGSTLREVSYEIKRCDLPEEPSKADRITDVTGCWRVNDITLLDDVDAWKLIVEEA